MAGLHLQRPLPGSAAHRAWRGAVSAHPSTTASTTPQGSWRCTGLTWCQSSKCRGRDCFGITHTVPSPNSSSRSLSFCSFFPLFRSLSLFVVRATTSLQDLRQTAYSYGNSPTRPTLRFLVLPSRRKCSCTTIRESSICSTITRKCPRQTCVPFSRDRSLF